MKAKPDKFQAMALGKKSKDHYLTFNLNGSNISCDDDVKLLGVTLVFRLKVDIYLRMCILVFSFQYCLCTVSAVLCALDRSKLF